MFIYFRRYIIIYILLIKFKELINAKSVLILSGIYCILLYLKYAIVFKLVYLFLVMSILHILFCRMIR